MTFFFTFSLLNQFFAGCEVYSKDAVEDAKYSPEVECSSRDKRFPRVCAVSKMESINNWLDDRSKMRCGRDAGRRGQREIQTETEKERGRN